MDVNACIETSIATLDIKDDILYLILKKDANVDLETVIETVEVRMEMQGGKKMLILVDNREVWQVTKEAQVYSSSNEVGELSIAMALLSGASLPVMLISNFFMRFNKLHSPTKIFRDEEKAIEWLNQFKEE